MPHDRYLTPEKVRRLTDELRKYIHRDRVPLTALFMRKGAADERTPPAFDKSWKEMTLPFHWGERDATVWFHQDAVIPRTWNGGLVRLLLMPSDMADREIANVESLIFLNGEIIGASDTFHREIIVSDRARGGERISIHLKSWCGLMRQWAYDWRTLRFSDAALVLVNKNAESTVRILETMLMALELFGNDTYEYNHLLSIANRAVSGIPFGETGKRFDAGVHAMLVRLEKDLVNSDPNRPSMIAVGHSHLDVAWLWRLSHTRGKAERTFANAVNLMRYYPQYRFTQSQPQLFQFIKEDDPSLYEEVSRRVKEGRIEPIGGMWVEADCNLISGESLVRQMLHGQRFYEREFGKRSEVLWLPDVFGYSWALPQIMRGTGQKYFMTTKITWSQYNRPDYDTFTWRGIDGSEVLAHYVTGARQGYNGEQTPYDLMNIYRSYRQKDINSELLTTYGYGDGGGGPTREMLERGAIVSDMPFMPRVVNGSALDFFKRLDKRVSSDPRLPCVDGELYLEYHRGTYTSQASVKRSNRMAEVLFQSAEKLSVLAMLSGKAYPAEALRSGWETILLHQFHDIIPGSSIRDVYADAAKEYERIFSAANGIITDALVKCAESLSMKKGFVIFNPLPWIRNDIVTLPRELRGVFIPVLKREQPAQTVSILGEKRTIVFVEGLPSTGIAAITEAKEKKNKKKVPPMRANAGGCENAFFKIRFDREGHIVSLIDKRKGREIVADGEKLNGLTAFEDIPVNFNAWDIDLYYTEKPYAVTTRSFSLKERGPVCVRYRAEKRFRSSMIRQDIIVYADVDRIDFHTEIDWKEHQTILKTAFPVAIHANSYTSEIQFGEIERANNWNNRINYAKFETVAHKWIDLSENDYGVSLLNDCKYGHDVLGNVMRITLIKSGVDPDPNADIGIHRFSYALYPHEGHVKDSLTVEMGYRFNHPLIVRECTGGGDRDSISFIKVYANHTVLDTMKRAEDSDDVIVRFYQSKNVRELVNVVLERETARIEETDMLENAIGAVKPTENGFAFTLEPFKVRTFRITLADDKKSKR
ncbi:MAG: glycoside hydrolase family 38 C-terminal domain-containing protein [Spirochaetota bacterium]